MLIFVPDRAYLTWAYGSKCWRPVALPQADEFQRAMETSISFDGLGRYADVLLDSSFKRSFKEYGNAKRLMQLFLEALIPERKIKSLEYTSEESTNQNIGKKGVRVDVECVDENGERFVVEVQRAEQSDFYDRAVFNSTFAIQRQIDRGADRYRFKPVYFIGVVRFSLTGDGRYLHRYSLREEQSGELMTDDLHYVFLDVTKCTGGPDAPFLEQIGYALGNMVNFKEKPKGLAGEFFDLLFKSADLSTFADEDKIKYLNDMTTERDIRNQIAFAHDKGVEEGREEGLEAGIAKGREEGREAERLSIARNFKTQGVPVAVIATATGLTEEQILAL